MSKAVDYYVWGKKLKELRERAGLTQKEAAEQMGLSERQWVRWEVHIRPPVYAEDAIARVLGLTLAQFHFLMSGKDSHSLPPPPSDDSDELTKEQAEFEEIIKIMVRFFGLRKECKTELDHLTRQVRMIHGWLKEKYPEFDLEQPMPLPMVRDILQVLRIFEEEIRTGEYPDEPIIQKTQITK